MSDVDLTSLLESAHQRLETLMELLHAEKSCLENRDLEQLAQLLETKQQLMSAIEQSDQQRRQLLEKAGLAPSQTGFAALGALVEKTGDRQTVELLASIESRLQQCRDLNEVNRVIVHRSRLNTQRVLSLLRGTDAQQGLYDNHGGTQGQKARRQLGSA